MVSPCGCSFPVPSALRPKAALWLRGLHRAVARCWLATIEDPEAIAIETAFAVVAVRVLDLVVYDEFAGGAYQTHREHSPEGEVVRGLTLVRNAEIHMVEVIEPGIGRLTSIPAESRTVTRVHPHWKPYGELPSAVQADTKTAPSCHAAYQSSVGEELVIETLLDVCKFFHELDPTVVPVGPDGEPLHFPLPYLLEHNYERRHPAWPKEADVANEAVQRSRSGPPKHDLRELTHRLIDPGSGECVGFGGWASADAWPGIRSAWVERTEQIASDVENGAAYVVEHGAQHLAVLIDEDIAALTTEENGSGPLDQLPVGEDASISFERLRFLEANPDLYVRMRDLV